MHQWRCTGLHFKCAIYWWCHNNIFFDLPLVFTTEIMLLNFARPPKFWNSEFREKKGRKNLKFWNSNLPEFIRQGQPHLCTLILATFRRSDSARLLFLSNLFNFFRFALDWRAIQRVLRCLISILSTVYSSSSTHRWGNFFSSHFQFSTIQVLVPNKMVFVANRVDAKTCFAPFAKILCHQKLIKSWG